MAVPQQIIELVETFKKNEHIYKDPTKYDEENTKIDFINPFFEALGWDVYNKKNLSPLYKDVEFESSVKVGKKTRAPDYAFRIGGVPVFFVEAKKPSVKIETDKSPAYQIRRYGWSAGLDLCILTDFETLAVYETNTRPNKNQNASIGRINFYHYTDYVEKWDEIANIFSKDAIEKGNFDNYVNGYEGIKKGTSEVDDEFLKEIEYWRELLARNIALRNKDITVADLNYAVQLIIDRIIFLRIAEDRGIETYGTLQKLLDNEDIYVNFCKLCREADAKYNSGLFHFTEEEDNDFTVDTYTLELCIDDSVFKTIFSILYYPNSPYEFSVLPLEILGHVYENFLGKTIRLTKGHQAKIEEKPEVKKSGGVYYTPTNVTKYIVKNTVGKLIKGKTPNKISSVKILDPSCGSGSFLLRAYSYLLDYHLEYYQNLQNPSKDVIYMDKNGNFHLTIREKKRILLNNIHGVDIDPLAVEVTKLSLLLKVLEDQKKDYVERQSKLFQERALPNLKNNVKCGNSLVGLDVYDKEYKGKDESNMQHPFDYETEFPEVFENNGFDCIIGNPPYVKQESIKDMKDYLKEHYGEVYTGTCDIYVYFFEKSLKLLKKGGYLGYICSDKYTRAKYGTKLRTKLINETKIISYDVCDENTFKASVDTSIIIIKNQISKNNNILVNSDFEVKQVRLLDSWTLKPNHILDLKDKIMKQGKILKDIKEISINRGITTGYNKAFLIDEKTKKELIEKDKNNENIIKPLIRGRDIKHFFIDFQEKYLLCTKNGFKIKKDFPIIYEYLLQYKEKLRKRSDQGNHWTNLRNCTYYDDFEKTKIVWQRVCKHPNFAYDDGKLYLLDSLAFLTADSEDILKYLVAIFNSPMIEWLLSCIGHQYGTTGFLLSNQYVEQFPVKFPENNVLKNMIVNVDNLIELHKFKSKINSPQQKKELSQKISQLEKQLNQKVYDLYNLTPEEVQIIEDEVRRR